MVDGAWVDGGGVISIAPNTRGRALLQAVVDYPGEHADRRIAYGKIIVAAPPEVDNPPSRWVEKMREAGWLRPARVRCMPHVRASHIARYGGDAERALSLLWTEGANGIEVGELARLVTGADPSGAFERTLIDLYRDGVCSPPAALWATDEGRKALGGAR